MQVLNWHLTRLILTNNDFVRLLITTFSLNNIRYGFQMLRDYYNFISFYISRVLSEPSRHYEIDETLELDYEHEADRLLQALMLVIVWSIRRRNPRSSMSFGLVP